MNARASTVALEATPSEVQSWFVEQGLSDGLPVIVPTPDLVEAMVAASGLAPDATVGPVGPSGAIASVEKVAINAVMAGCIPDYMPVVMAGVRAMAKPSFNTAGIQATTHPVAPLMIVNGPIRQRIGINCGSNAFGQGFRANATIGRAIRLLMMNIGGGLPGKTDMATLGSPAKFSYCIGENEEVSPWEPMHVENGLAPTDSAVTMHAGEAPHNVNDHASNTPVDLLMTIAHTMAVLGTNNMGMGGEMLVVFGPEHARIVASTGMTKDDVRAELHSRMRLHFDSMSVALRDFYRNRRPTINTGPEVRDIPYLDDPSQILIMVAGGAGLHSMVVPSFGETSKHSTERIG